MSGFAGRFPSDGTPAKKAKHAGYFAPTRLSRPRRTPASTSEAEKESSRTEARENDLPVDAEIGLPLTRLATVTAPSELTRSTPCFWETNFIKAKKPGTFGVGESSKDVAVVPAVESDPSVRDPADPASFSSVGDSPAGPGASRVILRPVSATLVRRPVLSAAASPSVSAAAPEFVLSLPSLAENRLVDLPPLETSLVLPPISPVSRPAVPQVENSVPASVSPLKEVVGFSFADTPEVFGPVVDVSPAVLPPVITPPPVSPPREAFFSPPTETAIFPEFVTPPPASPSADTALPRVVVTSPPREVVTPSFPGFRVSSRPVVFKRPLSCAEYLDELEQDPKDIATRVSRPFRDLILNTSRLSLLEPKRDIVKQDTVKEDIVLDGVPTAVLSPPAVDIPSSNEITEEEIETEEYSAVEIPSSLEVALVDVEDRPTTPKPEQYVPIAVDLTDSNSILEGLKHKAFFTKNIEDIQAVQVLENCITNATTCLAVKDIILPELRGEVCHIIQQSSVLLSAVTTIASEALVGDLKQLDQNIQLIIIISFDIALAAQIQLLVKQGFEAVQQQLEQIAQENIAKTQIAQEYRAWQLSTPIAFYRPPPPPEGPLAIPVKSNKPKPRKIELPQWRAPKPSLLSATITKITKSSSPTYHLSPYYGASFDNTLTRSERKRLFRNSKETRQELRSSLVQNIKHTYEETCKVNPQKRTYQDFLQGEKQPKSKGLWKDLKTSKAIQSKKLWKYDQVVELILNRPHPNPRTRAQRSGKQPWKRVSKGKRTSITTMFSAKRLCMDIINSFTTETEHTQRAAMFRTEIDHNNNVAKTTENSHELNPKPKNEEATPSLGEKGKDHSMKKSNNFAWEDTPQLNQPTSLTAPISQDEKIEESKNDSNTDLLERPSPKSKDESSKNHEDIQNNLAGLLLDDETEKSTLRLELSEKRAELRSQEQAERERKAQEEKERLILEEKLRTERLGRIPTPTGFSLFENLSDELEELADRAINAYQPGKQLGLSFDGTTLRGQDFNRLRAGAWLNDEIINAFIGLNVQHVKQIFGHKRKAIPVVETFVSAFYENLETGDSTEDGAYSKVKRWASRKFIGHQDFLKCNLIITPVNLGNSHWTLLAFWPKHRVVEFYDSFQDPNCSRKVLSLAKEYVEGELGSLYVDADWTFRAGKSPEQHNGYDCGVFVCTTAKLLLLGYEPEVSYTGANMAGQRKRIAAELLKGDLTGELDSGLAENWLR